ncbi:CPBP family intramembrane glutamic endopeptidase [Rubinisphaera italica]|uniref:CAAX amino terminal protease self-immunity n=1 Tax=Rubinisphaera italica TaxID=2527969 RepID=A0A5C5XK84_9PLAN|nr:type II CAAX endopeptidase family protein [Rubinisphaera italica]TWT63627.1 CAAX amino terminal protease self- immunity [Rubinisphaera italica]
MKFNNREEFLTNAGIFEFSLLVVALILGWVCSVQPTEYVIFSWKPLIYGLLAALPLFVIFMAIEQLPISSVQKVQQTVLDAMGRFLAGCNHLELALLALLAGIGEEILFRGFLMTWIESFAGYYWGLAISSLAFGLMHAVTWVYTIFATAAGFYFGFVFDITGERNLLAPIATHAFYDYLAFLVIVYEARKTQPDEPDPKESEQESFEW